MAPMSVSVGAPAPDFSLPADNGSSYTLSAQRGRAQLLVFYPGDNTPVCTAQLCDYRDGIEAFADLNVDVVGISADDAASHQAFRAKHQLPFTLLTDAGLKVAKSYGAKALIGMKRAVVLVDAKGIVRYSHVEAVALFRRERDELLDVIRALK
jgi:thioredoxin-dependent peroxiredoxin